jgi:hypothetical protein
MAFTADRRRNCLLQLATGSSERRLDVHRPGGTLRRCDKTCRTAALSGELVDAAQEESMTQAIRLGVIVPSVLDLALSAWDPRSDGIAVACLNFRSHPIIDALEARIGKPVVTSTQAVLWHLLRLAGVNTPIHGFGRLLREH